MHYKRRENNPDIKYHKKLRQPPVNQFREKENIESLKRVKEVLIVT